MVFDLSTDISIGSYVAAYADQPLGTYDLRTFEDGEHKIRPLSDVSSKSVIVICSLYSDDDRRVSEKLIQLFMFIGALKESGAREVSLITPYLSFARKDRKSKFQDPLSSQYIARLFEVMGISHMAAVDVHNIQTFENSYRIPTTHIETKLYVIDYLKSFILNDRPVIMSPDSGGLKRAAAFAEAIAQTLNCETPEVAMMHKSREGDAIGGLSKVFGNVSGRNVIIIDDLISSGSTLLRAAKACKKAGAKTIYTLATHGVFTGNAVKHLNDPAIDKVFITNTIPPNKLVSNLINNKIELIDISAVVGNWVLQHMGILSNTHHE